MPGSGWLFTRHSERYYLADDHVFFGPSYAQGFFFHVSGGAWDGDPASNRVRLLGFGAEVFSDVASAARPRDWGRLFKYHDLYPLALSRAGIEGFRAQPSVTLEQTAVGRGEPLPSAWRVASWRDASRLGRLIVAEAERLDRPEFAPALAEIRRILSR